MNVFGKVLCVLGKVCEVLRGGSWFGIMVIMISAMVGLAIGWTVSTGEMELQGVADAAAGNGGAGATWTVTYDVSARGEVAGDLDEFRDLVAKTLADERGWPRAGVQFEYVESGGTMHVILAEPSEVEAAAPGGCSVELSCRVGSLVLINDDRWMNGSDSYNELGLALEDYRQMVINHEVGHFLGHEHIAECGTEAGLAPIMLQQSTGLRGCSPNKWPLPNELWVKL